MTFSVLIKAISYGYVSQSVIENLNPEIFYFSDVHSVFRLNFAYSCRNMAYV
jgi:hypothetical protein